MKAGAKQKNETGRLGGFNETDAKTEKRPRTTLVRVAFYHRQILFVLLFFTVYPIVYSVNQT
jgi:hypothetical protein